MQPYVGIDIAPDTGRRWSEQVWKGCRWDAIKSGALDGVWDEDDFQTFCTTTNGYTFLKADATTTCAPVATAGVFGGVLALFTDTTDNNEVYLQRDGVAPGCEFRSGSGHLWFEVRAKISAISGVAFFLGLAVPGIAVANAIVDTTGALVDKSLVGCRVIAATPTALDGVHNTLSGGGITVNKTGIATLVADTFFKYGLRYDDSTKRIYQYFNGAIVDPDGVAITATNFPDTIPMSFAALIKTASGSAAKTLSIDKWRMAMQF